MRPLGWVLIQSYCYPYKKERFGHTKRHQEYTCTEGQPYEQTARGQPTASQGDMPRRKPILPIP